MWNKIKDAPRDMRPILCCFTGQFEPVYFVCFANGNDTNFDGYAKPTHYQEIEKFNGKCENA